MKIIKSSKLIFLLFYFGFFFNLIFPEIFFSKPYYLRHEIIKVFGDKNYDYLQVKKDNKIFKPFFKMDKFYFTDYTEDEKYFVSYIPLGFAPQKGEYEVLVYNDSEIISKNKFYVTGREIHKVKTPFHAITVEYGGNLNKIKVGNHYDKSYSHENIENLLDFMGIDNLFFMVGQTTAKLDNVKSGNPWIRENLNSWEKFAVNHNKLTLGGYAGCFLAFGPAKKKFPEYEFSYDYSQKYGLYRTNFISIDDRNRIDDIKKLIKIIENNPDVKYIGLDYIRAGQGGFENYDEFSRIFNIEIPGESTKKKILNLAKMVKNDSKPGIKRKWEYFRAYKTSLVIEEVSKDSSKPLWTFLLGWEQGHNHGQDPIMFTDAGADLIFVMLYEATHDKYNEMMKSWQNYLENVSGLQLIAGQDVDFILNDSNDKNRSGPEEMLRRYKYSYDVFSTNDNLKGFFIHDLVRMFYGRLYPYSSKEWLYSAFSGLSYFDVKGKIIPLKIKSFINNNNIIFKIKNESEKDITVDKITFFPKYNNGYDYKNLIIKKNTNYFFNLPYNYYNESGKRDNVTIIFHRKAEKNIVHMKYFK